MNRRLGVCYYPELYPENNRDSFVEEDIKLMKDAGFSVVRMAEFCWCLMEPQEGVYELDWLENIINKLGENGIYTVLCTPTATHPVWMAEKYPETLYVDNYGVRRSYGGRHYHCYNSPTFRKFTVKICDALGKRFGNNPYVIGYQIDNEMGQEHSARCCCPTCNQIFKENLREKFDNDIEKLNEAFGSLFWGQKFFSFDQVNIPIVSAVPLAQKNNLGWLGTNMPSLRLEFDRFCSESVIDFFKLQADVLKKYTDKTITHNTTHFASCWTDWFKMAKHMEIVGVDHYPDALTRNKIHSGLIYSLTRNYKDREFWLLETLCGGGHGNWAYQGMAHCPPGTFRQNIAFAYVSGAELITAFKWIVFPSGFEQLGSAMIDLDRKPGRRYDEFKAAGKDLKNMEPLLNETQIKSDVAVVVDFDNLWVDRIKPINKSFCYEDYIKTIFGQLMGLGINVDIIGNEKPFDGYKAVFLPFAPISSDEFKTKCKNYVQNGGNLIAMCMAFSRNIWGNGEFEAMPLGLTDLFGMRVKEVEPVFEDKTVSTVDFDGITYKSNIWQETLEVHTAQTVGVFSDTYRKDMAVATCNESGKGFAYYIGTAPDDENANRFYEKLLQRCSVKRAPISTVAGVDIVTRSSKDKIYYFVFNSNDEKREVTVNSYLTDYYNGEVVKDTLEIAPRGLRIVFADIKKEISI